MTITQNHWQTAFQTALVAQSVDGMAEALASQATPHAGTANAKTKNAAITSIRKHFAAHSDQPGQPNQSRLQTMAHQLCRHTDFTAQEIGAILQAECYLDNPQQVESDLIHLADSPHWEVREWAASGTGLVLTHQFDPFYPSVLGWIADSSANVRRCALLALMYAGKTRNPMHAGRILDALELLLSDRDKYVRDNLGPFALGSALIRYYPDEVLDRLPRWMESDDEMVRWNIAAMFGAAAGCGYATQARPILDALAEDHRPMVKRAYAKAMRRIASQVGQGV